MKKQRWLAVLLSVMMILSALPMTAMARPSDEELNQAGIALGGKSIMPHGDYTFDFAQGGTGYTAPSGLATATNISYGAEGLTYGAEAGTWRFYPATVWSPFAYGDAVYFKVKIAADSYMLIQAYCNTGEHSRVYTTISPTAVSPGGHTADAITWHVSDFVPGTDYVEYMVQKDAENNQIFWAKGGNYPSWTKLFTIAGTGWRDGSNSQGLTFVGTNSVIPYAAVVSISNITMATEYDSIEEIMGGPVSSSYVLDFDGDFDPTIWNREGKLNVPSNVNYSDENGLEMFDTEATANWNYYAYSGWSPFSAEPQWADYEPQAVYFKVKGDINVQFRGPNNVGRFYIDLKKEGKINSGSDVGTSEFYTVMTDGDWMEYLIVPDADSATSGFTFYAKGNTTDGKWAKVSKTTGWKANGGNTTGISFFSNMQGTGAVKSVRTYQLATAEADTIPADATYTWYNEDMSEKPVYGNLTHTGVTYDENGYANFPATSETGRLSYDLSNSEIPVGGYAEFRARSNGCPNYTFCDGATAVTITQNKDYGEISGVGAYLADVNLTTWRTWRVVRSEEGYTVYSKAEGDVAWLKVAENISQASTNEPCVKLSFGLHADDTNQGISQLDYLKIVGPAREPVVTLTDGAGTKVLDSSTEPEYLDSIHAIIRPDNQRERTFIFGVYGRYNSLLDVMVEKIPAGNENVIIPCNALQKTEKVRGVKAFLWDNFVTMNRITEASPIVGNTSDNTVVEGWTLTGGAVLENGNLTIDSYAGEESYAEYPATIGSQYDISWDLTMDEYSGNENVQIYNGSYGVVLTMAKDGISYNTNGGSKEIPWVINHGTHTYRLMGSGASALLFIDGYFAGELSDLVASTETEKLKFWNKGSDMRIKNITYTTYAEGNIPSQGFVDEFENGATCGWSTDPTPFTVNGETFEKQWINSQDGYLLVEDYHIAQSPNYCRTMTTREIPDTGDDFLLQLKVKFPSYGAESEMILEVDGQKLAVDIREKFLSVAAAKGYSHSASDELLLGTTDYHLVTIESYNNKKNARVFLNGTLIQDTEFAPTTTTANQISFRTGGGWFLPAQIQLDYIKYSPKYYGITLSAPVNGAVYQKGSAVTLSASESATFEVNGVVSGTGTSVTLNNLPTGTYEVVAKSGYKTSKTVTFTVEETASATLSANQSGTTISASLASVSGFGDVASVTYLLDGKKVATATSKPYSVDISEVTPENHKLEAVAYNGAGMEVIRVAKEMSAVISNGSRAYSNEVEYVAAGDGVAVVKNGNHLLQMTHSESEVTYLTDEGAKTYEYGTGTFKVLTDGPIAEVYRNGQYVFSFYMPKTKEVGKSFTGSITNSAVSVPKERQSWFAATNVTAQNEIYELANLSHNHNLDFVASPDDEAHLVLNDGYYRNDITLKGGKIYVMAAKRNNSTAEWQEIADMASGEVYYRVETSGGMSRLYADGRWITTFRNGNVAGRKGTLSVDVTGGDGLSYLGVNSNQDLYLLNDTFDQSGIYSSLDYWMTSNGLTATQSGEDLLLSASTTNGVAELSPSVGNASLTAHLTITTGTEGFWFLANHCVTNSYTKVGFNYTTNQFEIVDVIEGVETVKASQSGSLATNARVLLKLAIEETETGKKLTLYVNGTETISTEDTMVNRGRIGFMVANGSASLGYVVYRGDGKLMLDVRDNPLEGETTLDMIETEDITYLVNQAGGFTTTDNGKTWTPFDPTNGAGFSLEYGIGMTKNMVTLANGEILSIYRNVPTGWADEYGQRRVVYQAWVSKDNGMNWSKRANIGGQEKEDALQGRDATVNRVCQGPSGRVYYVSGEGNSEDYGDAVVWYSDDNGSHWTQSSTVISALNENHVIAEAALVETTKDTRLYFRSDTGQLWYYTSEDRGATWDLTPHTTPFISSMTCFGIEADPADPDTLYMGWGYDNINFFARAQFPRTRWAVAKSTDGGDTWEMLGTAHENNSIDHNMMNLSLNVGEEYIYLNAFSSDTYGKTQPWTSRIVSFPKTKQQGTLRLEQLHTMSPTQIENTLILPKEKEELALVISPSTGGVLLRGQLIPDVASGNYVAVDVLASLVGATVGYDGDGTLTLTMGSESVTIGTNHLTTVNEKKFVHYVVAAEKLGLVVTDAGNTKIISSQAEWSTRQKNALRDATDLF